VATGAADRVFDALGDPMRRALVGRLSQGPMSVSELVGRVEPRWCAG
jgi:DNA-binding transcriptional ArsR family regulator